MARIIAVANQKGGVGKTTTVANIGAILAEKGHRVLLVDLDPQASLTAFYGFNPFEIKQSVYQVLLALELDAGQVVHKRVRPCLDLIPSQIDLAGAEIEMAGKIGHDYLLHEALAPLRPQYDYILIDCGPGMGILTINALTAADEVLIPVVAEYLSLRGLGVLLDTLRRVHERTNSHLALLGIVVTLYEEGSLHSNEALKQIKEVFGDRVFQTPITRTVRFAEAAAAHMPLAEYAPELAGYNDYRPLVEEILHVHRQPHPPRLR